MVAARREQNALSPIELPAPVEEQPVSLFTALTARQTIRSIDARPLNPQQLSNLLWAAWGVNRKSGPFGLPGRTAASASNSQEIDIFVALDKGAYLFDATAHRLDPVVERDLRTKALHHRQHGVDLKAPVQLIFVVDIDRLTHTKGFQEPGLHDPDVQKSYYFVDTGLIAGNVYLYAAAYGLAAWFHNCDKDELAQALRLRQAQKVLFAQSVGYAA